MLRKLLRRKTIKSILFTHLFLRHNAIIDRYVTHVNLDVARQGASSTPVTLSTNRMIFFFFIASSRSKIHSSKTCPVIQAFLFASYGTRKFLRCLKHQGFLLLPMLSSAILSSPVRLPQRSRVILSLIFSVDWLSLQLHLLKPQSQRSVNISCLAFPFPLPALVSILLVLHLQCFLIFDDRGNLRLRNPKLPSQFSLRLLFFLMGTQNCNGQLGQ